jgi:hypothetical protein
LCVGKGFCLPWYAFFGLLCWKWLRGAKRGMVHKFWGRRSKNKCTHSIISLISSSSSSSY